MTIVTDSIINVSKLFGVEWEGSQLQHILKNELDLFNSSVGGTCIAGGSLIRHLSGGNIYHGDIDVYFSNRAALKKFREEVIEPKKLNILYSSKFSECYELKVGIKKIKIQLINNKFGIPSTIIKTFDLRMCKISIDKNENCHFDCFGLVDIALKQINIVKANIHHPAWTFDRIMKYKALGFINADNALKDIFGVFSDALVESGASGSWHSSASTIETMEIPEEIEAVSPSKLGGLKYVYRDDATKLPIGGTLSGGAIPTSVGILRNESSAAAGWIDKDTSVSEIKEELEALMKTYSETKAKNKYHLKELDVKKH